MVSTIQIPRRKEFHFSDSLFMVFLYLVITTIHHGPQPIQDEELGMDYFSCKSLSLMVKL